MVSDSGDETVDSPDEPGEGEGPDTGAGADTDSNSGASLDANAGAGADAEAEAKEDADAEAKAKENADAEAEAGADKSAVTVEGSSADWLRQRADEVGLEPDEYANRVIATLRAVESGDEPATADDLATLEERISSLDEDIESKIQDVRDRVIQVKRETDAKAPDDHEHPGLRENLETNQERVDRAEQTAESLEETVDAMEERFERGFENYEEILQHVVDRTDDLSEEAGALREVAKQLKRNQTALRAREQRRQRTDAVKADANRKGVTEARCESCGNDVTVALLTEPACPFCGTEIADVTPKPGFFGTATLNTGAAPALEEAEPPAEDAFSDLDEQAETSGTDSTDPAAVLDEDGSLINVGETETDHDDRGERG
ncbi:hypothetical protein [Halanaeroarchaeum sulfurireducens]|uniref:Uncharacterized protein n=1 Tax=Halanaeroarchaeum sulfurireducens TaxID=1604004 RepID=A0A0N9N742_9EURY|nr:hypothetical protein [Halanaeroarchaeum sulfurireducens]ALG82683.1 hypothetical protein HLASA_1804 [Halanaeroarchaeum sulfurireducens]